MARAVTRGRPSGLTPAQEVVLQLADVLLSQPSGIPASLRQDLSSHYLPEQVLELTLDVMKWSYQKIPVALGTDDEVAPGRLSDLAFDDEGNARR